MRMSKFISASVMGVVLAASGLVGVSRAETVYADSQTGFSGTQGLNGWTYTYGSTTQTPFASYDPNNNMYGQGSKGVWYSIPAAGDARMIKEGQHPNTGMAVTRTWTSTVSGLVKITGALAKYNTGGGDGVDGSVLINGVSKYAHTLAYNDGTGVKYGLFTTVNVGDQVSFRVDPKASDSSDATKFTATIASPALSLADIVGGGNGLGTGTIGHGINQDNGAVVNAPAGAYRVVASGYHATSNPFIDGVFGVDGGAGGSEVVTSTSISASIPNTSGFAWDYILNTHSTSTGSTLSGVNYDNVNGHTMLALHANSGITFDLNAINGANAGLKASDFSAMVGLGGAGNGTYAVLLDGITVASGALANAVATSVNIDLTSTYANARFLTLISTEGTDNSISNDGVFFGDPEITMHAVPEPSAVALLACGLLSLMAYAWRKRR